MQIAPREQYVWKLRSRSLSLGGRTLVMGILNLTPDSFSDGGSFPSLDAGVEHALAMLAHGADILDIGGESTRPGTGAGTGDAISAEEEQSRILPTIRRLRELRPDCILSVDTYRASTARLAVEAGAEIVNDVSGMLWDADMPNACGELGCGVVAMHTRGRPSEWKNLPPLQPAQVLPTVLTGLKDSALRIMLAGCERHSIVLDPGFGFGKAGDENWTLLREMDRLRSLGFPLLAGVSRKGFLGDALRSTGGETAAPPPYARDEASSAASMAAALAGAHIVRVHDVKRCREALAVADALRFARS